MSVALRKPMTAAEYLRWEECQEVRHEYDGYGPVAMAGAREAHADIQANLITSLRSRMRGHECRAYGPDTKIEVDGSYRYPDVVIISGPRDAGRVIAPNPVVVFEILSGTTAGTDRVTKYFEYRNIQRYIIIEQTVIGAEVFARSNDWLGRVQGQGSMLELPEVGIAFPLDELFKELDLAAGDGG